MGMTPNQLNLVKYVAENNLSKAKQAALACCIEDKTQKNSHYVQKYQSMLQNKGLNMMELPYNIMSFATMEDLSMVFLENRYYLTKREEKLFFTIQSMYKVSNILMEKRIPYLNATLLYGESGCGKTEFSKYVAYKMQMPYLYVNFSKMIDSHLGESAKNLSNLFAFINQQQCVVMLDELDSLAIRREYGSDAPSSEIARTTTCLLQLLDTVTNDHIILAATNLKHQIDLAVLRRFTKKHEIQRLNIEEKRTFIIQYLSDVGLPYESDALEHYILQENTQADILTHLIRCIAKTLLEEKETVVL